MLASRRRLRVAAADPGGNRRRLWLWSDAFALVGTCSQTRERAGPSRLGRRLGHFFAKKLLPRSNSRSP
eukprot:7372025-Prymnesium_polylepis.1